MILDYGRLGGVGMHAALQAKVARATSAAIPLWMGADALGCYNLELSRLYSL